MKVFSLHNIPPNQVYLRKEIIIIKKEKVMKNKQQKRYL